MSLIEFDVERDKFEFDEYGPLCFPCCACKHRLTNDNEEPCRTCDHNSNAVEDNAKASGAGATICCDECGTQWDGKAVEA